MEILPGRKREKSKSRGLNNRLSLSVWLFYIGIVSLSLTSVTFSRYSTVVRGTISVQVAAVRTVTFMDGDNLVGEKKVYEGQSVKEAPTCPDKTTVVDGVSTTIPFLGWSQSPDAIDTVIPEEIAVDKDLTFYAVYGEAATPKLLALATPSEAIATSSNAAAPEKTTSEANITVSEPAASAEPEPSAPTETEVIPTEQEPSLASSSNATADNNN